MSKKKSNPQTQYYTMQAKKVFNLMVDADRSMRMYGATVKLMVEKYDSEGWSHTPVPDYMDAYLNCKVLKEFLETRLKDPSEIALEYMKTNNFDGLFLSIDELELLYKLINNFEESKEYINKLYGVTTLLN